MREKRVTAIYGLSRDLQNESHRVNVKSFSQPLHERVSMMTATSHCGYTYPNDEIKQECFCVLDQNEFVKSIWKVNLSNLSHGGGFVGRTTRSALIVKSEVNTVFDSSFYLGLIKHTIQRLQMQ